MTSTHSFDEGTSTTFLETKTQPTQAHQTPEPIFPTKWKFPETHHTWYILLILPHKYPKISWILVDFVLQLASMSAPNRALTRGRVGNAVCRAALKINTGSSTTKTRCWVEFWKCFKNWKWDKQLLLHILSPCNFQSQVFWWKEWVSWCMSAQSLLKLLKPPWKRGTKKRPAVFI